MSSKPEQVIVRSCTWPSEKGSEDLEEYPAGKPISPIFEIRTLPGRGRGLFALNDLTQGTLILAETPLFTLPNIDTHHPTTTSLIQKLRFLSPTQQHQFNTLHNNYNSEEPLIGIIRTNVLDISPAVDAIYPTFSLLNHSCVPNAHYTWNANLRTGTLYAIGAIQSGGEITISYGDHGRGHVDFACSCTLCSSCPVEMAKSDVQRTRLMNLRADIVTRVAIQHESCLLDLREMRDLLRDIYGEYMGTALAWMYFTASEVAASQSDLARASVFVERAYRAREVCEGAEHPLVVWCARVREDLSLHVGYRTTGFRELGMGEVPGGLGGSDFERWLWTWE